MRGFQPCNASHWSGGCCRVRGPGIRRIASGDLRAREIEERKWTKKASFGRIRPNPLPAWAWMGTAVRSGQAPGKQQRASAAWGCGSGHARGVADAGAGPNRADAPLAAAHGRRPARFHGRRGEATCRLQPSHQRLGHLGRGALDWAVSAAQLPSCLC